ncbi:MAG TPA: hypothetical protein VNN21_03770 [Dehalococcoidia bacterium]|nr:hypothetical protein [Dehalococcoidia bacterium]
MIAPDPQVIDFSRRRREINDRLDATRRQLDALLEILEDGRATIRDLALFEGLLQERRDLLAGLARLDDAFLDHIIELRSRVREE